MAVPSPRLMASTMHVLAARSHVLAPWNHAALTLLEQRGHAKGEAIYQANGRLAKSKLWSITAAGLAWQAGS